MNCPGVKRLDIYRLGNCFGNAEGPRAISLSVPTSRDFFPATKINKGRSLFHYLNEAKIVWAGLRYGSSTGLIRKSNKLNRTLQIWARLSY